LTSDSNLIDAIEADSQIKNEIFEMKIDGCVNGKNLDIEMVATIPNLHYLGIDGDANITTDGLYSMHGQALVIDISGNANVELMLANLQTLLFEVSGNGDLDYISGNVEKFLIDIDGTGDIKAFDFNAKDCDIKIDGTGTCEITATENLDIKINGDGNVCYKGTPAIDQDINGDGEVTNCN